MEPVNCVIEPTRNGGIRLHDGCQIPTITQGALANVLKLKPEQIEIKTYYAGVLLEEESLLHQIIT